MSLQPSPRDPFRTLAIIGIVLGLALVLFAAVFWAVTGRESSLLVGAGLTLSIGGGLRNLVAGIAGQIPAYESASDATEDVPLSKPDRRRRR